MSEIEHPGAYAAAVKRRIIQNARVTYTRNTPDFLELFDFLMGTGTQRGHAVYDNGHMVEGETFLSKMAYSLDTFGKLTDKQTEAVRNCIVKGAARKAEWAAKQAALNDKRLHLGEVGKKVELTLTIKKLIQLQGASFSYYDSGLTNLYIMEDSDANVITYIGNSTQMPRGDAVEGVTIKLSATVKEHTVRNEVKQTVIQRPKRLG
jgi:hypothetical protein